MPRGEREQRMRKAETEDLGERLQRERIRSFVGRTAELEIFAAHLDPGGRQNTPAVLWVHGPGGIGKSSLLQQCRALAEVDGVRDDPRPGPMGDRATAVARAVIDADDIGEGRQQPFDHPADDLRLVVEGDHHPHIAVRARGAGRLRLVRGGAGRCFGHTPYSFR